VRSAGDKTSVHTFTIILANGKRISVKFNFRWRECITDCTKDPLKRRFSAFF
jgi:catalase